MKLRDTYEPKSEHKTPFRPVPTGIHLARCFRVIDLGTKSYMNERGPFKLHMVDICFEVHSEDENGKPLLTSKSEPMTISDVFPANLKPGSKLRNLLVGWRGRDFTQEEISTFEFESLLGVWGMINVVANKAKKPSPDGTYKTFHNIDSVTKVPSQIRNAGLPQEFNKTSIFDIENPNMEVFESLSQYMRSKIEASEEWQRREYETSENASGADRIAREKSGFDDMDDDIPF